jgi:outer membrane protein insertion porin family
MRRQILSLALLMICASFPLPAVELYEERKVSEIHIEYDSPDPHVSFDPKPVLAKLRTKEGDQFSQFTFDNDLKTLSEEYDRVQPSLRVQGDQVFIVIHVVPRPVIHQIRFEGNEKYSTKSLLKELEIKPYTVFNRQEFNKAFNKVKEFYIKKGYFESQISYSIYPLANTNEVDIVIDVKEGKSGNIKKIDLLGFSKTEESDIVEQMVLKKYNFLTSWLTGTGKYRDEMLEQDQMTIVNYLHNLGYADARVDIQVLDDTESDKIIIQITAERGILYHFGSVKVDGNNLISTEDIYKRSVIEQGELYSPEKVRETANAIKDLYGQKGYIDASVQYETFLSENEPTFDVEFTVDEGQEYKIGLIHIFGNYSTKNNVILRESLLVPGETFDSRKLKATQQRLEAIGYFKTVNVYAVRTSDDLGLGENYRDVYIEVEETTTGNVSLFMGFSSTDSVFGGVDLTERNFNIAGVGKALTGSLSSLRGGGQFFHIRATIGKKEDNLLLSWVNPYVNDTLWRVGVELSQTFSELTSDNDRTRTYGGSLFANYPLSSYWTAGMRERLRHTSNSLSIHHSDNPTPQTVQSIELQKQKNDAHGLISALSGNIAYDSCDSAYKPHRGWRSYLEGELAGVGGRFHFLKFSYLNTIYVPATRKGTFKFRGEIRFISPYGSKSHYRNVPYSERLFLGGEGTVRGYKPFVLGPKVSFIQGDGETKYTETPLGGLSSCLLSAEYNYEVFRMFDVFAFFDAGSVTFNPAWSLSTFRCSAGLGVRLEINRGTPIMIGYGWPINPERKGDRQQFFFSMGGQF